MTTTPRSRPAEVPTPATRGTNLAVVRGTLSSDPTVRELPSGEVVHSYEVTVRELDQPTASVPVVMIGPRGPRRLAAGDEVVAVGRIRRRFFRAGGGTASRTELVAERLVPVRRAARVAAALADVEARLDAVTRDR